MTIMSWFFVLIVFLTGLCHGEALARKRSSPWCLSMNGRFGVRGGADFTEVDEPSPMVPVATIGSTPYISELEIAKAMVLKVANTLIDDLRQKIVDQGVIVENFGLKADAICNQALEEFAKTAPQPPPGESTAEAVAYDRQVEELDATLDAPLQVLFLRQLALLREKALQKYRTATTKTATAAADYEAMLQADAQFTREAKDSSRQGADWDFSSERSYLQSVMNSIAESAKRTLEIQMKSAQQQQTAMQFLQGQQQMIQQLQMQLYGQTSPWNVGVAYRIPDTNFNLQGSYQQGRANVQLSCVPDEYAPMLGPNGFTNGVGPGNLGLSLNLSI